MCCRSLFPCCLSCFSFAFGFRQFHCHVSCCAPPWVYPAWDTALPGRGGLFLSHVREFFSCFFKCFLGPFLSLSFWEPRNASVGALMSQTSQAAFISFPSFSCILLTVLSSRPLPCSASVKLLLVPSGTLFTSVCSLISPGLWETLPVSFPLCFRDPESSSLSVF